MKQHQLLSIKMICWQCMVHVLTGFQRLLPSWSYLTDIIIKLFYCKDFHNGLESSLLLQCCWPVCHCFCPEFEPLASLWDVATGIFQDFESGILLWIATNDFWKDYNHHLSLVCWPAYGSGSTCACNHSAHGSSLTPFLQPLLKDLYNMQITRTAQMTISIHVQTVTVIYVIIPCLNSWKTQDTSGYTSDTKTSCRWWIPTLYQLI